MNGWDTESYLAKLLRISPSNVLGEIVGDLKNLQNGISAAADVANEDILAEILNTEGSIHELEEVLKLIREYARNLGNAIAAIQEYDSIQRKNQKVGNS